MPSINTAYFAVLLQIYKIFLNWQKATEKNSVANLRCYNNTDVNTNLD